MKRTVLIFISTTVLIFLISLTPADRQALPINHDLKTQVEKGLNLIQNSDFKKARKHFRKLKKAYPKELDPAYYLNVSQYILSKPWDKKLHEITKSYNDLIEQYPNQSKLYIRKAQTEILTRNYQKAKLSLEKSKHLNASTPETYFYLGYADLFSSYYSGPKVNLYNAMKNFRTFLELTDSSNVMFDTAKNYRLVAQEKMGVYGSSEFESVSSSNNNFTGYIKFNSLLPFDTLENQKCDNLNSELGVFEPLQSMNNLIDISYSRFMEIDKLSDIIGAPRIISFKVVTIRMRYDDTSDNATSSIVEIKNIGNTFSDDLINFIKEIEPGEKIYFENIETESGSFPHAAYRFTFKKKKKG